MRGGGFRQHRWRVKADLTLPVPDLLPDAPYSSVLVNPKIRCKAGEALLEAARAGTTWTPANDASANTRYTITCGGLPVRPLRLFPGRRDRVLNRIPGQHKASTPRENQSVSRRPPPRRCLP